MKLRYLISFIILLLGLASYHSSVQEEVNQSNLLFAFLDQFRPLTMGFMNEDPVLTPNIDRFVINRWFLLI